MIRYRYNFDRELSQFIPIPLFNFPGFSITLPLDLNSRYSFQMGISLQNYIPNYTQKVFSRSFNNYVESL